VEHTSAIVATLAYSKQHSFSFEAAKMPVLVNAA